MHKKIFLIFVFASIIIFGTLPFRIFAINDVQITDVTNLQILTSDTSSPTTIFLGAQSQGTNFSVNSNYIDITLDNSSSMTFITTVSGQYFKIIKESGSNDYSLSPSCPTTIATLNGTGARTVLRLEVVTSNQCSTPITPVTPSPSGGGGGGGGAGNSAAPITSVTFTGRAYPLSKVVVLKDGQIAISTIAGPDANFQVTLTGLTTGDYTFGVYGEDSNGLKSSAFTFPMSITSGSSAQVGGIFISPTIAVDKSEVKQGDNIAIFGQTIPDATVTISVHSSQELFGKTTADKNGVYLYNLDTTPLDVGQHTTQSKSAIKTEISSYGKSVDFTVGKENVGVTKQTKGVLIGDVNLDGKVDLVDFSIEAYWYEKPNPPKNLDLNGDGIVDLVDFSIMAYYWTG